MIKLNGKGLTQWDVGRYVTVNGAQQVHLANAGDSKAVVLSPADGKVPIPNFLLTTGKNVLAYAVTDGITQARYSFPVNRKPRPENYVYEDDQRNYIYELIDKVEKAAKDSEEIVAAAGAAVQNANDAASRAEVRADDAHIAAGEAEIATGKAEKAAANANACAISALTAAGSANDAARQATTAAESINAIADDISAALDAIIAIQEELMGGKEIAFFIAGTEYTAKEGMTWAEWCDSEYNTYGYICRDNQVGWWEEVEEDYEWWFVDAAPSDVIIAGAEYDVGA